MHPSTEALLKFFEYQHLPERLQNISRPFCVLAHDLVETLPNVEGLPLNGPELTMALRKLLEAKDCAVRAAL